VEKFTIQRSAVQRIQTSNIWIKMNLIAKGKFRSLAVPLETGFAILFVLSLILKKLLL